MNAENSDTIQRRLLEKLEVLLELSQARDAAAGTVELDQTSVGRVSRMDALQGQAMSVELRRRREMEIQRIRAALTRVRKGEYGYCLDCGEDIASGRLRLDPATTLCVSCASEREKK